MIEDLNELNTGNAVEEESAYEYIAKALNIAPLINHDDAMNENKSYTTTNNDKNNSNTITATITIKIIKIKSLKNILIK